MAYKILEFVQIKPSQVARRDFANNIKLIKTRLGELEMKTNREDCSFSHLLNELKEETAKYDSES